MKKVWKNCKFAVVALVLGLTLLGGPTYSLDAEAYNPCPHIATRYYLVEVPTCEWPGWYYVQCGVCGKITSYGEINPRGHEWVYGLPHKKCSRCGAWARY